MNDHLDPEIAAAWLDGSLDAGERTRAETHAADCDRCRAVLAAMVRTEPPVARRAWFTMPAVRWLAPLATAAVALLVWSVSVARRPLVEEMPVQTAAPSSSAAPSPSIGPAPSAAPVPSAPSTPQAAPPVLPRRAKEESAAQMRPAEPLARQERFQASRRADVPASPPPPARQDRQAAAGRGGAAGAVAGGVSPDAAKPIDAIAVQSKPLAAEPDLTRDRAAAAAPPAPPPPPANPAQPGAVTESVIVTSTATMRQLTANEVRVPGTAFQWRLGPAGRIEHSADGGKTWTTQNSGVTTDLRAGAAPLPDVCWVVGRGGVVLLSTDRRTWRRIAFSETVDLVGVTATDAATAAVTAADGRVFRTSDGGKTWTR